MLRNTAPDRFTVFDNHCHPTLKTGDQPRHALIDNRLFFTCAQRCQRADKRCEIGCFQRIVDFQIGRD